MARTKSYIEIEGIFDTEVLGTFSIIRGFALLQDLARISVPVFMKEAVEGQIAGHQRELDQQHAEDVKRYFAEGDRRFIPEIILSVRANLVPEKDGLDQLGVSYDANGIKIERKHTSRTIRIHTLRFKIAELEEIRKQARIRRIDGNHRLALAEELQEKIGQGSWFKVPFCLILLGDIGGAADDYTEALIFHTINSTATA